jgi:5-methylcytosine-specific restriction endonuclease McrA
MPWRPPSHRARPRSRKQADAQYNAERRAAHGPDPRSTARWQRLRRWMLHHFPWCMDPYGMHVQHGAQVLATEVDHRVGVRVNPALAFEPSNLQTLCHACHARKSGEERRGVHA